MADESVKILIDADDKASAKVVQAAERIDQQIKRVKDVGGKAKASTEFIGTLANQLGGTQIGGFAGELAGLTERITAFSEVSKAGGLGAMAFKAGLVAAAGVAAWNIGTAIGEWAFEADKWRQAMVDAEKAAQGAAAALERVRNKHFANDREELGLIRDPAEREAAINKRAAELEKFASEMTASIAKDRAAAMAESDDEMRAASLRLLETRVQMRDSIQEEASSLRDMVSERTKNIEALRAENAAAEKSDSFLAGLREQAALVKATAEERRKREAAKNTNSPEAAAEAERLLAELDLVKQQAEAEKEKEVARRKEEAEAERIAGIQQKELERLEERRIAIEQGAEAAKAYALEQQGIDAAAAKSLAAQEAELKRIEEAAALKKEMAEFQPGTQATQGRLLTRGPAERGIDKIANATERANVLLDEIKVVLLNPPSSGSANRIVVVG